MLNTASTAISLRFAVEAASSFSSAGRSLWGKRLKSARATQAGVIERRMVEPVGEHRVIAPDQCGHDAEVGHVAAGKQQRARRSPTKAASRSSAA